jgi:TetR/AcrR family transcriptional repressor of nem operon
VHITKASVHHHFPSKADLVQRLVHGYRHDAQAGLAALEQKVTEPAKQLAAYIGHWAECIRNDASAFCICVMLAAEVSAIPAEVRAHFRGLNTWVAGVLERGESQGVFALQAAPEAEAMAFMAVVNGAMLSARAYGEPSVFTTILQPVMQRLTAVA